VSRPGLPPAAVHAGTGGHRLLTELPNLPRMTRIRTAVLLALSAVLVVVLAAPALATESQPDPGATTTTVAPAQPEGEQPAVVIPDVPPEEEAQPWTSRFLYPTIVAVTIILILGLVIGYNRSIRHRYKVIS
jgi:uncharacterized membrane protein YhiD involved in acid resistance